MKLSDIVPSKDLLKLAQGVEASLVRRRRTGTITALIALAWATVQVLLTAQTSYLEHVGAFVTSLLSGDWDRLFTGITPSGAVGIAVVTAGFGAYFLLNWTSFLLKESDEPFRYTFWIEPFSSVGEGSLVGGGAQLSLLHRDLMEKLNQRIQRLSLLERKPSDPADGALKSHIHVGGSYAVREEKTDQWVIHVMARIRVGPPGRPETLTYPVKYPLSWLAGKKTDLGEAPGGRPASQCSLDVDGYQRIVERVYSRVATEIYRQIEIDVKQKIDLFPTSYLRAIALFREAQDLAKSNTIDAYDHAIALYRQAVRYFSVANVRPLTTLFLKTPLLWRLETNFVHTQAMVQIGFAQSLIYRRIISEYSGRHRNTLFEISGGIPGVIEGLAALHNKMSRHWKLAAPRSRRAEGTLPQELVKGNRLNTLMALFTFPRDSWITPLSLCTPQDLFQKQTKIFFDCYVVAALNYQSLGATQTAKRYLADAKAAGPGLSETNALYLLTAGEIEPDPEKATLHLRQATELAANFEIAQYRLAKRVETLFRMQDELLEERSRTVMREYDLVLAINPGNIAALLSQGYLWWLLGDLEKAKEKFDDGRENKAIARQTFVGELNYGLARIAAEEGRFGVSYDLYTQTIASDPGVGAYSQTAGSLASTEFYDNISPAMLERIRSFKDGVEAKIARLLKLAGRGRLRDADGEEISERMLNIVHSLVLNDYGNACLNYFWRHGDESRLDEAIAVFKHARDKDPESKIVPYNLHKAFLERDREEDRTPAQECLEKAERLGPTWPTSVFALAQVRLRHVQANMVETLGEAERRAQAEEKDRERNLARVASRQASAVSPMESSATGVRVAPQPADVQGEPPGPPETQRAVGDSRESARSLYEKAMSQLGELVKALPEVQKIMETTKLSSIYEGFAFDLEGKGVDRLLSAHVGRDRLDENDVRALRLWAEVLSNNIRNPKALQTAEKICTYILDRHYPESFEVISIARTMYLNNGRDSALRSNLAPEGVEKRESAQAIADSTEKVKRYTDLLKPIVRDWTERGPASYAELTWVRGVLDDEAVRIYEKATKLAPKNPVFWIMLGNARYSAKEFEISIDCYKQAIRLKPKSAEYRTYLGNAYRELKRWEEAQAEYRGAVKLEPKNAGYRNSLGNNYFSAKDWKRSIECYRRAIELEPKTAIYHSNLGDAFEKLKRWEEAQAAYRRAVELEPGNADYRNSLGAEYFWAGDWVRSIEFYKEAIELEPKMAAYHANLGDAFEKLKRWKEAQAAYRRAVELEPGNAGHRNSLGNDYFKAEDWERAIECYKEAIGLEPESAVYHSNLGSTYGQLKQWEEAQAAYRRAVELEPANPGDSNSLGNTYYWGERYDRAADCYRKAIELNPKTAVYHSNLGGALEKLAQWNDAQAEYRRAAELDPKNAEHLNGLGNAYFRADSYESAVETYRKAIELDSKTAVYYGNLGHALEKLERWQETQAAYRRAAELDPKNAEHLNGLGNAYFWADSYESAVETYRKAIELDSKTAVYYGNLGRALEKLERWQETQAAYRQAVELDPKDANDWNGLGNAYFGSGRYDLSAESYRKAIELDPAERVYRDNLERAVAAAGNTGKSSAGRVAGAAVS